MDTEEVTFQFRYVNEEGNPFGLEKYTGRVSWQDLALDKTRVPLDAIALTTVRDDRINLTLERDAPTDALRKFVTGVRMLTLEISKASAVTVKREIDRYLSVYRARENRLTLEEAGRGDTFRCLTCPECEATLDVSGLAYTPYVYCPYCESIAKRDGDLLPGGPNYRLCDECGWFDRVQGYTEFYFYYLVSISGASAKRRYCCDNCINRIFWKALALNVLFLVGIPPAIWMKLKSLRGREAGLESLALANKYAKAGRTREAQHHYVLCLDQHPGHPGIHYDQALGALLENQLITAHEFLNQALQQCGNYTPALYLREQLDDLEKEGD